MAVRRKPLVLTVLAAAVIVTAGCSPDAEPRTVPSSTATPAPAAESPVPYAVPSAGPDEIARAVFEVVDGVDTTDSVLSDALDADDSLTVEGQCEGGEWMTYALRDSRPEGDGAILTSGRFRCDSSAPQGNTYGVGLSGTVQVVLTVDSGTERAWVTVKK
ncbi:hypothetical protein RWH44_13880 [Microbacterium sp. KSW2-29]|uniref:Lipoprotein n=1 Tax=Microbacterium phycohabitans TaxID=3075993 RepID=A0ABU3SQI9_9MICO|nr:hypothetical protein [Microbacterium sp. KSW2-29]MDU0346785.1 hypothetical protein [Microbacterium sp. KSW2-29]